MERKSGILMPLFSLPSKYGIGTLGKEAYKFADFLVQRLYGAGPACAEGGKNLDVFDTPFPNLLEIKAFHRFGSFSRICAGFKHKVIAILQLSASLADSGGVDNNAARIGLPVDHIQHGRRNPAAFQKLSEHIAWPDTW